MSEMPSVQTECEGFDIIFYPPGRRKSVYLSLLGSDHRIELQDIHFGGYVSSCSVGVFAVAERKPLLVVVPGYDRAQREYNDTRYLLGKALRKLETAEKIAKLVCSPRAKDRNKGRRMARRAGLL